MLSRALLPVGCLLMVLVGAPARAELQGITLADLTDARVVAMGGAFRATGLGAEAAVGNPAALGNYKAYNGELTGGWDIRSKAAFLSTLVRDSATSQLAAGVGYQIISTGHGANRRTTHFSTLSLGLPLGENFSIGVAGHYLGREAVTDPASAMTVDAGILVRIGQVLNIGLSGHNLVDTRHEEMPRYYTLSAAVTTGALTIAADARSELQGGLKPLIQGGLEYALGNTVPIRGGYSYDVATKQQFVSGGIGFSSEGSGVDVGYRHEIGGSESQYLLLSVRGQF